MGKLHSRRDHDFNRLVRQEELILDVTERLSKALEDAGITRAELARRLGRSPAFVTQVFGGGRNLTLRTIADIAAALSLRPTLEMRTEEEPLSESQLLTESRERPFLTPSRPVPQEQWTGPMPQTWPSATPEQMVA